MRKVKELDADLKQKLAKIALTVRGLAMDAVQKADSGHPGLPMGCAELGAYLWGFELRYNPKNPNWFNRDRFILSAGHGSMWIYSLLHLSGYDVSMEDLKQFRQLHSHTPGHPEKHDTPGIETTTGPLGQGVANAVGQALGFKILAEKFNTDKHKIIDNKVYFLMGDGCMMEGISHEASSLAGHLKLNNLIGIYDSNHVCLDGPLSESASENTKERYLAYGWDVWEIDGHDFDALNQALEEAKMNQKRPCMIIIHTVIGRGSPHKEGTHNAHGAPLGVEEIKLTKELLGLPQKDFYVVDGVYDFFAARREQCAKWEEEWKKTFDEWSRENPELFKTFEDMSHRRLPKDLEERLRELKIEGPTAGRTASSAALQLLADLLPQLYGGSADLSCSDNTTLKKFPIISPGCFKGRNIKFGVREFAMASAASGLSQTNMITPFVGTFLTFSDYMRNAVRLCSMMKQHVMYQFTHDSIFLGEDGPTHQPIEHYAALRAIPNLYVFRPGDANEVKMSWLAALRYEGPSALIFSRQKLPNLSETDVSYANGVGRGGYIVKKEKGKPDYTLLATGSELHLALDVANELEKLGKSVRVVSMPCWELYELQPADYKEETLGGDLGKRVSIEAGVEMGWHKYIGREGIAICMKTFGLSAPYKALAKEFGFTVDAILEKIL